MSASPPCCDGQESFTITSRITLNRHKERGSHAVQKVHEILDEARVCHVSYVPPPSASSPEKKTNATTSSIVSIPQLYGRSGDWLYLHGSISATMMKRCRFPKDTSETMKGVPLKCVVSVTLIDSLVLARALFSHSMNYRSVVIFADEVYPVTSDEEKNFALKAISENTLKGRWEDTQTRKPNAAELQSTGVIKIKLSECSAKIRNGPPKDSKADLAHTCWAGVVPIKSYFGTPMPDEACKEAKTPLPSYITQGFLKSTDIDGAMEKRGSKCSNASSFLLGVITTTVAVAAVQLLGV
mmetsp:Transcript_13464/g.26439  ORF Transcript_13464/g.26439 Transcript_13464/m.26439 type:complete len:297 (+) Transcript_13464:66-956(+)